MPVWLVAAALPAAAREAAVRLRHVPSLPGLSTRIGTLVLLAPYCDASDSAVATWPVDADCVDWIGFAAACRWLAAGPSCSGCPAAADEAAVFDCVTVPSLPGLRTRIEMFVLLGSVCVAPDAAVACCEVSAD